MIGDDVGFRRRHSWRAIRLVQHAWSRLQCTVYGHYYRPSYSMWGSKAQYTCDCCGEKTPWMNKEEHAWFEIRECPTWGDRGTDSQNHRFVGPPEPEVKPWRPRKGRKRYRKV